MHDVHGQLNSDTRFLSRNTGFVIFYPYSPLSVGLMSALQGPNYRYRMLWRSPSKFPWYAAAMHSETAVLNVPALKFEDLISTTIDQTKDIPEIISETGKVGMPHKSN